MFRIALPAFFASLLALTINVGLAQAQSRVFVAAQGSDANPCTFALPCRTFQHAHDVAAAGGEIDVLDPAGYGALNITKAISIQGHGFAGLGVAGFAGITVGAGAADAVSLNGLLIEGNGVGQYGIQFNTGGSLVVENCIVRNMTSGGLTFFSTAATLQTLSVSNSYFADHGGFGIDIRTFGSGALTAAIERVAFYAKSAAGSGLYVNGSSGTGAVNVAVTDSVAAHGGDGFIVQSSSSHSITSLVLTRSLAIGNNFGI